MHLRIVKRRELRMIQHLEFMLQDMVNRLVDKGRKYNRVINVDKLQVMTETRINYFLLDNFILHGSVLTTDRYWTEKRILTRKKKKKRKPKNTALDKQAKYWTKVEFIRCYIWNIALYDSETWTLGNWRPENSESF